MKFHKTLMTFLIVSNLVLNRASADDSEPSSKFPTIQVLTKSVKIELPSPNSTERQKFVINVTPDNGFICHNFLREKEIKDKLFSLQALTNTIPELEKKLLETPKPVAFIESNTVTSVAMGAVIGLITGFFISRK